MKEWKSEGVIRFHTYAMKGLANAFVWFTNPTFFVAFKEKYLQTCFPHEKYNPNGTFSVLYLSHLFLDTGIMNQTRGLLEDKRNDLQQLTLVLRKNILTCILLSIRHSVRIAITLIFSLCWPFDPFLFAASFFNFFS